MERGTPAGPMTVTAPLLIGVDVGTTMIKAGVLDAGGQELAEASAPTPWRALSGATEADPEELVGAVRQVLAAALAASPPGEVAGLGVASMAETAVVADAQGVPLAPVIAWHDRRAEADFERMRADFSAEALASRTGLVAEQIPTIATLRWLARHHPDTRRAAVCLSVAEWVVAGLGGSCAAEASLASRTGAFSVATRQWWPEIVSWAGLPAGLFGEVRQAGTSWGRVGHLGTGLDRLDAATLTVAGHDHLVAAIGCGVTEPSQLLDSCGTAEALLRAVPAGPRIDPAAGLGAGVATGCHVLAGHYCLLVGLPLGLELVPLLERLGHRATHGCSDLDADVLAALDGAGGPLSAAAAAWRAALEGAVARTEASLGHLQELGGAVRQVRVTGGWSANPVLHRLKGRLGELSYPAVVEAGVRGAALLAGLATGVYPSVEDFPRPIVSSSPVQMSAPAMPPPSKGNQMRTTIAAAPPACAVSSVGSAGKAYRMGRIFGADGRSVILPLDHGSMLGRVPGLEDPVATLEQFFPLGCDGFLLGPGLAERTTGLFARRDAPARLVTIDTYWRGSVIGAHVLMTTLGRAAGLGVDGVKVLMPWDVSPEERAACSALVGEVISGADEHGLPVMVEPIFLAAPRPAEAVSVEADGARMAAELGADIIKVAYPGDPATLAGWCSELRLPIVVLGGPAGGSAEELCAMVEDSLEAGARGITIGRRIWQRPMDEAAELLARLVGIVHGPGISADRKGARA